MRLRKSSPRHKGLLTQNLKKYSIFDFQIYRSHRSSSSSAGPSVVSNVLDNQRAAPAFYAQPYNGIEANLPGLQSSQQVPNHSQPGVGGQAGQGGRSQQNNAPGGGRLGNQQFENRR
jgi:hypothetical protein